MTVSQELSFKKKTMKKRIKLKVGQIVKIKSKEEIDSWATTFDAALGGYTNTCEAFFFPAEKLYLCGDNAKVYSVESKYNKTVYTLETIDGVISGMVFIRDWLEVV